MNDEAFVFCEGKYKCNVKLFLSAHRLASGLVLGFICDKMSADERKYLTFKSELK